MHGVQGMQGMKGGVRGTVGDTPTIGASHQQLKL